MGRFYAGHQTLESSHDAINLLLVEAHLLQGFKQFVLDPRHQRPLPAPRRFGQTAGAALFLRLLQILVQTAHLIDDLAHPFDVPRLIELGVVLVRVFDDFFDPNLLLSQLVAQIQDLLDGHAGVEHHLQHATLAVLDALGNLHLALAGEQGHRPHLAQVHAHGVVGLGVAVVLFLLLGLARARGLGGGARLFSVRPVCLFGHPHLRGRVHDLDAFTTQGREPVVDLVGRHDALGHVIVDFVISEKPLGPANGDELAFLALALLA